MAISIYSHTQLTRVKKFINGPDLFNINSNILIKKTQKTFQSKQKNIHNAHTAEANPQGRVPVHRPSEK